MSYISQQHTPLSSPELYAPRVPNMWVLLLRQADYMGSLIGLVGLQSIWLPGCLVWRLPTTCWCDWAMRHLTVEPWVALGLVPVYWWAESCFRRPQSCDLSIRGWSQVLRLVSTYWLAEPLPGVQLQCPGIPKLILECWWVELVPDTIGYWTQGLLELLLAC